ncbi:hypothetical protein L3Q82_001871 [Scortum barcoo]|uniref:Uncharacterized protein n=1 Tax=Scortum barcoo TaxID=214431 RepID=A0ACB8W585_9TELE|nr:hypothetical protein L3Q82_001871 [Scortum barcoo]
MGGSSPAPGQRSLLAFTFGIRPPEGSASSRPPEVPAFIFRLCCRPPEGSWLCLQASAFAVTAGKGPIPPPDPLHPSRIPPPHALHPPCLALLDFLGDVWKPSLDGGVQKDHVTPIYVINLLISDLIQLCCMIIQVARPMNWTPCEVFNLIHFFGLTSSVGFMVCVAMERYLVVAWPLWYRFRRTIKSTVVSITYTLFKET